MGTCRDFWAFYYWGFFEGDIVIVLVGASERARHRASAGFHEAEKKKNTSTQWASRDGVMVTILPIVRRIAILVYYIWKHVTL